VSDISSTRRTLWAAKIIFDFGQSSIDCVMRRISSDGATLEVESVFGSRPFSPRCRRRTGTALLLLDSEMKARFINRAFRKMWALRDRGQEQSALGWAWKLNRLNPPRSAIFKALQSAAQGCKIAICAKTRPRVVIGSFFYNSKRLK